MRTIFLFLLIFLQALFATEGMTKNKKKVLSHSFELRYVTSDEKANGETDYKGATEFFTTDKRIEYLSHWSNYAITYFNDQALNQQAVSDNEVKKAMNLIKPQPLTEVRKQIRLKEWK